MSPIEVTSSASALKRRIEQQATSLGFDLVGVASCLPSDRAAYFRQWIDAGAAGEMHYLAKRFDERVDVCRYVPGARSVICLGINYHVPLQAPPPDAAAIPGKIARYALGDDYHEVLKSRLHALADWIRTQVPECVTRACVDTAPVLEKELAHRSGIGWMGKNTCLIHPRIGSWLLLGEVITTLELAVDEPMTDHCGSCTRCIDACPTQAITEPYRLDATRCISYLTIETRNEVADEFRPLIGDWLYGCDICQDVCPFNRKAPASPDAAWKPRFPTGTLDARSVLNWTDEDYRRTLSKSAMKRVKLPVLKRNAQIVIDNAMRASACRGDGAH